MQAWLSLPFGDGALDLHLMMKGAARAVAAAVCMNLRRVTE
jgi:hypothetical protein